MSDPLPHLKRVNARRERAERDFKPALLAAVEKYGPTVAGEAIGWTKQRVRQQITRWTT